MKIGKELSTTICPEIQKGACAIDHLPDWALKAKKNFEEDLLGIVGFILLSTAKVSNNTSRID